MSLYSRFKVSKSQCSEGAILDLGGGTKIWCARANGENKAFSASFEAQTRNIRIAVDSGGVDNDEGQAKLAAAYADGVVKKWEGVTDEKDSPMECNRDNIIKLFTDLPDLFQKVIDFSTDYKNYLAAGSVAHDVKN